jgi:broad specificity phosphatase PhoE
VSATETKLIIIRHAERPEIADGAVGNELTLTKKGEADSVAFAQQVSSDIISIRTSPIVRCVQTAQIMASQWGYPLSEIQTCKKLGDPGFFIRDSELAWQSWLEKGAKAVNQHLLTGRDKWPGFVHFDMAILEMKFLILKTLATRKYGTHVWVTHDTILATIASRLLPSPILMSEWPSFLGMLEISLDHKGKLKLLYLPHD